MGNGRMTEALHDAQDAAEDLAERASAIVDETVKGSVHDLLDAMAEVEDPDDPLDLTVSGLFEPLALLVEERLADITTEAVRTGFDSARKLREVSGG